MRSHSYINTTKRIIDEYDGSIPLSSFLKQFFKEEKKFGSTDRKQIAHACYCYYRLGKSFQSCSVDERILYALFLCSHSENIILKELKPEWNDKIRLSIEHKLQMLDAIDQLFLIFPFVSEISPQIISVEDQVEDIKTFNKSFLIQPDLHLRIRPGNEKRVRDKLADYNIQFADISSTCIALANGTKVEEFLQIDKEVVVQDLNSQHTLDSLNNIVANCKELDVWDCCAASGGKSILLYDKCPKVKLSLSDLRNKIIYNLQNRFERAGIRGYYFHVHDASTESMPVKFQLIICDAPCSGSGTWSRTPEQAYFFDWKKINHYSELQKKIVVNASKSLKSDSYFIYITCSVFTKENEEVVDFIQKNTSLQLVEMTYLKGYDKKADTLFTALFKSL